MAINFDIVTGNQTSSAVLSQINQNFSKINSNSVPNADNSTRLNNKDASNYLPGATEFKQSITTQEFNNLTTGRYFCTQTEQSWEPLYTTTGIRSILLEANIDETHGFKNYNLTYISGVGAGSKYYSHFENETLIWDKIGGALNSSIDYYKDIIIIGENNGKLIEDKTINFVHNTYKSWTINIFCNYDGTEVVEGVTKHKVKVTYNTILKNKQGDNVQNFTFYDYIYGTGTSTYGDDDFSIKQIVGPFINQTTGDMIIRAVVYKSSAHDFTIDEDTYDYSFYCSSIAPNGVLPITIPLAVEQKSSTRFYSYDFSEEILGWYNNIIYYNYFDTSEDTLTHHYIILDSTTRSTSCTHETSSPTSGVSNLICGGQMGAKYYFAWVNEWDETSTSNGFVISQINFDATTAYPSVSSYDFYPEQTLIKEDIYDFSFDSDNNFYLSYVGFELDEEEEIENTYYQLIKVTNLESRAMVISDKFNFDIDSASVGLTVHLVYNNYVILQGMDCKERVLNKNTLNLIYSYDFCRYGTLLLGESTYNPKLLNTMNDIGPIKYYNQVMQRSEVYQSFIVDDYMVYGFKVKDSFTEDDFGRLEYNAMITSDSGICLQGDKEVQLVSFISKVYPMDNENKIGNGLLYHDVLNLADNCLFDFYGTSSDYVQDHPVYYIDGIGLCFGNHTLDLTNQKYMIKSIGN